MSSSPPPRKAKGIPSTPSDGSLASPPKPAPRPTAATPSTGKAKAPAARKGRTLDPDELAALEEQRDFLLRSLKDLEREHDAGDLEDDDYQTLKDDYTSRAADVLRAIDEKRAAFADARKPRSLGRTFAVLAAIGVFAVVSGVMVAQALGSRSSGETSSGGITVQQTNSQKANECSQKIQSAPQEASDCLEAILEKDQHNPVALTWSAWLLSLSANNLEEPQRTIQQGLAAVRLDDAVESDPNYSYARAFRAVVAYRNGRLEDAQEYLQDFKDHDPSADAASVIRQMGLEADIAEGLAGGSSTTAPGATTSTTAAN